MKSNIEEIVKHKKYLELLASEYPTVQKVATSIINMQAVMDLPKGTEHFMSDLHGEHEAFLHILNNASGVIKEKVNLVYANTLSASERSELATLIYYPEEKLALIKKKNDDIDDWYRITLHRLIEVCKVVASKYPRSKVRHAMPKDFEYIIDELLHTNDVENKELYFERIIATIIDIDRADAFISALASLIKHLAVDRLHIVGDIFDRGARPDIILDSLINHHSVDIQWGNHDILWMGAAAGSRACIANVLNVTLQYSNLDVIETGYGINLRPLIMFAQEAYADDDCQCFAAKVLNPAKQHYEKKDMNLIAKIHKAVAVMLFKLEGQLIKKHHEYGMEDRLLLDKIDFQNNTVMLDGKTYPIKDTNFPTVNPENPYELTPEEEKCMDALKASFIQSEKLQKHVRFLYAKGGLYLCFNSNLLFHGCIPLQKDGSFTTVNFDGRALKGKELMDYAESMARLAYFGEEKSVQRKNGRDFMWYLWCGKCSPLFGRNKMSTFEKYLIEDKSVREEPKNPYYSFTDNEEVCSNILREFGLDENISHIINGHVPVKTKDGESPVKANGKLIVIDGGFCRAYQPTTGIAGYTLIYNSHGMRLISHEPFENLQTAIENNKDIISTSNIFETVNVRKKVSDTEDGNEMKSRIDDLKMLLEAYRVGVVKERRITDSDYIEY